MYIKRLASKEISSPSNKIHREVGRAKDLLARWYIQGVSRLEDITAGDDFLGI
jgi:hypothetical protein